MANIDLKDTIELMVSENYKDRFKAEFYQLKTRRDKLHAMIVKYAAGSLDFEPSCPLELLEEQEEAMDKYIHILEVRAEIEKIEL